MTPDLAAVPTGWQAVRLGDVAEVNPKRPRLSVADDTRIPFIPMAAVGENCSGILVRAEREYREVQSGYTYFEENDVLFSKITPCLQNGKHALAREIRGGFGFGTTEFHVVRAGPDVDTRHVFRVLTQSPNIERCTRSFSGTAGQQRVQPEILRSLPLLLPPLPEQRAIAAVLDDIDEVIERTEEVIAATERLRDALLHELLTRGLPGRHSEWVDVPGLGTVPACWEVARLGDVCEVTSGFAMGPRRTPRDHPRPYLTVANVRADQVTVGELRYMELTDAEHASRSLRAGDLVVVEGHARVAQLGRAAIVPPSAEGFTFQNHLFRVRLLDAGDLHFVAAHINGSRGRAYFASFGGTTSGLNTVSARNVRLLPVPWPSDSEQRAIAATLDSVGARSERAREARARLQSLQASVADALLTGRVRVRVRVSEHVT